MSQRVRTRAASVQVLGSVALLVTTLVALGSPARADWQDSTKQGPVHAMTFPVIGKVDYTDTYGAPRSGGRHHQGQDLLGAKMQKLVAAADGTITWEPIPEPSYGYMIALTGQDGWDYWYLHLNDDNPGTNDGQAPLSLVFGPGIRKGVSVRAGQLLGYMGDSGDAEGGAPHLHFELHDPNHTPVNPFASLNAAPRLSAPTSGDTGGPPPGAGSGSGSSPGGRLPRRQGPDRAATAAAASAEAWPSGAARAVIASGDHFEEALPATVLAAQQGAPLLLSGTDGIGATTRSELERLHATAVTTIGSVPASVDDELRAAGLTVTRLGQPGDVVGTSVELARAEGASDHTAVLVNEERFADAIGASALAAGRGWPILLSGPRLIPQPTVDEWRALGVSRMFVIGGPDVLSERIAQFVPGGVRLAGDDRYGTSVAVTRQSLDLGGRSLANSWLATGTDYPDGIDAGSLAARTNGVAVLVDGAASGGDRASRDFLKANASVIRVRALLGGPAAISDRAESELADLLHGSPTPSTER
ncbi:MAG: cell wall-binding repeat-containing protein [Acidimicrobiales bacterium]